jgi:hypothetical protein
MRHPFPRRPTMLPMTSSQARGNPYNGFRRFISRKQTKSSNHRCARIIGMHGCQAVANEQIIRAAASMECAGGFYLGHGSVMRPHRRLRDGIQVSAAGFATGDVGLGVWGNSGQPREDGRMKEAQRRRITVRGNCGSAAGRRPGFFPGGIGRRRGWAARWRRRTFDRRRSCVRR